MSIQLIFFEVLSNSPHNDIKISKICVGAMTFRELNIEVKNQRIEIILMARSEESAEMLNEIN